MFQLCFQRRIYNEQRILSTRNWPRLMPGIVNAINHSSNSGLFKYRPVDIDTDGGQSLLLKLRNSNKKPFQSQIRSDSEQKEAKRLFYKQKKNQVFQPKKLVFINNRKLKAKKLFKETKLRR